MLDEKTTKNLMEATRLRVKNDPVFAAEMRGILRGLAIARAYLHDNQLQEMNADDLTFLLSGVSVMMSPEEIKRTVMANPILAVHMHRMMDEVIEGKFVPEEYAKKRGVKL